MSEKTPRYITTTLPYVNADPHIGFGLEVVQADALARYWRLMGHEVFFNTGTDEHGQKIAKAADEKGEDRQAYVDHFANEFNKLKSALDLSYDNFVRTSSEAHKAAAQEMWRICAEKGDIYKKKYSGLYCVGCEAFVKEGELVDGKCPIHPNLEPQQVEEENYFFALSKYKDALLSYLKTEGSVAPDWRRDEAVRLVEYIEDISISREKKRMDWGVPVPGDDEQVMYVWFDALTNYVSTLGWPGDRDGNFKKFWEEGQTLQVAGKDQVRFQSVIWQGMLLSAGLPNTDTLFYHGFINSGGHKMSKSLGNVISPYEMVERYGTDATRYILLRHVHPFDDSDLTWERMDELYTANLVNGLGNLVARVMKMAETHLERPADIGQYDYRDETVDGEFAESKKHLKLYKFNESIDVVWKSIGRADEIITEQEPFKIIKEDKEKGGEIIQNLMQRLWRIAVMIEPFMPDTARIIQDAVKANKKPDNLFSRLPE